MKFTPVKASKNIVEKYLRYLSTIFEISDEQCAAQFKEELKKVNNFAKGPYLDVTDSFEKGKSINTLMDEKILPVGFKNININLSRPLYKHQENAIIKIKSNKNIVVSTGTGSGKTESFLIPILRHLVQEDEKGELNPGVRALIIYPMNALANDQIERLREILSNYPKITYGCYTGQTLREHDKALAEYKKLNDGKVPLQNELISRNDMVQNPPHILITNYAMLEYLMIRPTESIFFSGEYSRKWKFVVLDEAHVYNGSTGIEVSMLLSRLKAKINCLDMNYILTSATLGGEEDNEKVAQFATDLCSSKFDKEDIIRAKRVKLQVPYDIKTLDCTFYEDIARILDQEDYQDELKAYLLKVEPDINTKLEVEELLFNFVIKDKNYWLIKKQLCKGPMRLSDLADFAKWTQEQVSDFVTVASMCKKDGIQLFDARYHMFLKATESAFVALSPSKKIYLNRQLRHYESGKEYKVFEFVTCTSCHAMYLVGRTNNNYFEQVANDNEIENKELILLRNHISDEDEDFTLESENIVTKAYELCVHCGHLVEEKAPDTKRCEHGRTAYTSVYKIEVKNDKKVLTKCLVCENINGTGILRGFYTGQEAVTSVIGTALYEEMPSYSITNSKKIVDEESDEWGFGTGTIEIDESIQHKCSKQFIAFSDSRQAAAYYASYLNITYTNIIYKRLIVAAHNYGKAMNQKRTVEQFIQDITFQIEKHNIIKNGVQDTVKEAWKALLKEMVDISGNTSLCSMGLLCFEVNPNLIQGPKNLNLEQEDVVNICNVLLVGLLSDVAIAYPIPLTKADKEYFTHNGVEYSYSLSDANPKEYRRAFIPTKDNGYNKRVDYLLKILEDISPKYNVQSAISLLKSIWEKIFVYKKILVRDTIAYKINPLNLNVTKEEKWFKCNCCSKITPYNVRNICPTFKCKGKLAAIDINKELEHNHYFNLYQSSNISSLKVVEHTAQLNRETAYDYQQKFKNKDINVLSCSTTFEMGVDVGSLETVFMRNMPPSPANYAQRAGRAGRSVKSAAYAITFCNKGNHDFSFFKDPESMIRGKINPPAFKVSNPKIAVRHLFASTFGFFWSKYPKYFSDVKTLLDEQVDGTKGTDVLATYLYSKPENLKLYLMNIFSDYLIERFGIRTFRWIDLLLDEEQGILYKAIQEYNYEMQVLADGVSEFQQSGKNTYFLEQRIRAYKEQSILAFLSRKNVLPKYGFPVDTVELQIIDPKSKGKVGLDLQRDLAVAISEYAPSSQIVANDNLITSRFIRKMPNRGWKMYDYYFCDCKTLNIEPHNGDVEESKLCSCKSCLEPIATSSIKTFIIPEYGFEADGGNIQKPGLIKPVRTYNSEVSYVGYKNVVDMKKYSFKEGVVELGLSQSDEMAVLNQSNFFVCETCGYTELESKRFTKTMKLTHKKSNGYKCACNILKNYALGYRFETDVVQVRFMWPEITEYDNALSILYGLLKGLCRSLTIEENDVSGCVQYFYNENTHRGNFAIVLYDKTPGGSGHVRRMDNEDVLKHVLEESLKQMKNCDCGGETGESSCYSCLRSYYNQRVHDRLQRRYVIEFLKELLGQI